MNIQFTGTNYEPAPEVLARTRKKLESLTKYVGKDTENVHAQVLFGKTTEAHKKGDIWQAEVNLTAEGVRYNATAVRDTITSAVNAMAAELSQELRRARAKSLTQKRQGGSKLKNFLRFGRL